MFQRNWASERETSEEPPMATKHRPGNDSKQNYEVLRGINSTLIYQLINYFDQTLYKQYLTLENLGGGAAAAHRVQISLVFLQF